MPGEDPEDERAGGPPPHPADRPWVHPSELTSFVARSGRPTGLRLRSVLIGVAGAMFVAGSVLLAVTLVGRSGRSASPSPSPAARQLAAAAGASVVAVHVQSGDKEGRASGVCISDRHILTSAHALGNATGVAVVTADGRTLSATVAGRDSDTDLATLTVAPGSVTPIKQEPNASFSSDQQLIGVAAGSTGRRWVDVGEVQSTDKYVESSGVVVAGLVNTDMTAADQHSGGAVLDQQGALVGILVVPPGSSTSGLVLPMATARDVASQLVLYGRAVHGWLGVGGSDDRERAGGGVQVESVVPKSPADGAGLRQGDVIVAIGTGMSPTAISTMSQLMTEVRRYRPGDQVDITLYRDGGKRDVRLALGDDSVGNQSPATTTTTGTTADSTIGARPEVGPATTGAP